MLGTHNMLDRLIVNLKFGCMEVPGEDAGTIMKMVSLLGCPSSASEMTIGKLYVAIFSKMPLRTTGVHASQSGYVAAPIANFVIF